MEIQKENKMEIQKENKKVDIVFIGDQKIERNLDEQKNDRIKKKNKHILQLSLKGKYQKNLLYQNYPTQDHHLW